MSTNNYYLSFCIPVYNEEQILLPKIDEIQKGLARILKNKNYEILIAENGSTDNTLKELKKIKEKNIYALSVGKKGHGLAFRNAILKAKGKYVLLTAIDLPFGFTDLEEMLKLSSGYDIIFGSKSHPKSIVYSPLLRKISSQIYRSLLRLLFNVKIGDTQGTVFLKRRAVVPLLKNCDSDNAFFSAQLAIFAERNGLSITEVPVKMRKLNSRKSKYNVFTNGGEMLLAMFNTYLKIHLNPPKS